MESWPLPAMRDFGHEGRFVVYSYNMTVARNAISSQLGSSCPEQTVGRSSKAGSNGPSITEQITPVRLLSPSSARQDAVQGKSSMIMPAQCSLVPSPPGIHSHLLYTQTEISDYVCMTSFILVKVCILVRKGCCQAKFFRCTIQNVHIYITRHVFLITLPTWTVLSALLAATSAAASAAASAATGVAASVAASAAALAAVSAAVSLAKKSAIAAHSNLLSNYSSVFANFFSTPPFVLPT